MTLALDLATLPLVLGGGALLFIALRFALRQIGRVLRVARFFVTLGVLFVLAAGVLYFAGQAGLIDVSALPVPR